MPAFIEAHSGPGHVFVLDLRTRAEAMFVSMRTAVDALVPPYRLEKSKMYFPRP
ncbi:MAG: hypothetical protein ABI702_14880 [Burkholderiales bacterium]